MGIFEKYKAEYKALYKAAVAADQIAAEELDVLVELEHGIKKSEIWAKALERSKDDKAKAKELYIAYRKQSMEDEAKVEELKVKSIMDNMKPKETYLFNECTKILERKGYALRVDGANGFTINVFTSKAIKTSFGGYIHFWYEVKARTTSLLEVYKLAKECNRTKALRNERYFWAITISFIAFVLIQNMFFGFLMIIIVASFMAFEPESDDISFTVSDKKGEPETDSLSNVTTDTIWVRINRALTTF